MTYPNLLRRYTAAAIDVAVVIFIIYLGSRVGLAADSDANSTVKWPLLLFIVYEPIGNRFGATIGQLLMRFRVRTFNGQKRVPIWRGIIRVFAKYLLGIISFVRMPVQKQRRALHDFLSGTIVLELAEVNALDRA